MEMGKFREGQPGGWVSAGAPLRLGACMCTQHCPKSLLSQYMENQGSWCSFLPVLCQRKVSFV